MPKLLVVDDSAVMRQFFKDLFADEQDFELEFARTGREALDRLHSFGPDVLTLDINMPEMDGLTALSHIMSERPTPVVMVSALTTRDALATLDALALGAVDHIAKPSGASPLGLRDMGREIKQRVIAASRSRVRARSAVTAGLPARSVPATVARSPALQPRRLSAQVARRVAGQQVEAERAVVAGDPLGAVIIGVSTGGPRVLEELLPGLPAEFPWPVVVVQHMPRLFTGPFAQRLDQHCRLRVVEASEAMPLQRGTVYVAQGGADTVLMRRRGRISIAPCQEDPQQFWHPSVEVAVRSALTVFHASSLIGVMLTGMGYDGADAMAELRQQGGRTIAESEETAVVYGMPGELVRRGGASQVARNDQIAGILNRWLMC